ncbi:MAG TPA: TetR/AcrR family transcriptional regulator [Thiothrix sp.]|nr:TetR/AcrR family transcriptional regulator [Thiothrix sp.]
MLLQAAFMEIHRMGYQAASLQNILKNTGLTKGALYHHFPNKKSLGYAVLDEIIRGILITEWVDPLQGTKNPIDALIKTIKDVSKKLTQEDIELGCPLNNLAQEMSPIDPVFCEKISTIYTEWREAIEQALEQGKTNNTVKKDVHSQQVAIVFTATLEGCMGMAKNAQSMELLLHCGQGLITLLDTLRPNTQQENEI